MAILSANINPKLREERKAAENAKAILGTLTPSTAGTDHTIFILRYAATLRREVLWRGLRAGMLSTSSV
jgi:hypothetical protein